MCGRYAIFTEEEFAEILSILTEIEQNHQNTQQLAHMKTGEIFPTNIAPVVGEQGASLMTWGFKQFDKKGVVINARSETAAGKPMFSRALRERRVAVPTTGFYEWLHEGKHAKEKFLFRLPDSDVVYLAGIYTEYATEDGGREARFAILTTDANESMRPYHNRMPVYVATSELDAWIHDSGSTGDILYRRQPELIAIPANAQKTEQISFF